MTAASGVGEVAKASEHAAHVGYALDNAGHGVLGVDFVFEVGETFVVDGDECLKDFADGHDALTDSDLAFF